MNIISGFAVSCVFGLILLFSGIGALCWPERMKTWLEYAGREPGVLWGHGALLGVTPAVGQLSIPIAIVTWSCHLFLGA